VRNRKIHPDSLRDTEWQAEEYERQMGHEAALRQEIATRKARGECTCRPKVIRRWEDDAKDWVYRTLHQPGCIKHKPWMDEERARSTSSDPSAKI